MEIATTAFLVTVAIVAGILSPVIIVLLLTGIVRFLESLAHGMNGWAEDIKKRPPFDEVEVNVSPATNQMVARFLRNGVIIWQGASSRREMEENDIIKFTTEDAK